MIDLEKFGIEKHFGMRYKLDKDGSLNIYMDVFTLFTDIFKISVGRYSDDTAEVRDRKLKKLLK